MGEGGRAKFRLSRSSFRKIEASSSACSVESRSEIDRFFEKRNALEVFGLNCDTVSDFDGWMRVAPSGDTTFRINDIRQNDVRHFVPNCDTEHYSNRCFVKCRSS